MKHARQLLNLKYELLESAVERAKAVADLRMECEMSPEALSVLGMGVKVLAIMLAEVLGREVSAAEQHLLTCQAAVRRHR